MADFNPGDVVELKSGGPKMTIKKFEDLSAGRSAVCDWFEGNKPMYGTFPLTSLKHSAESSLRRQAGGAGTSGAPSDWMRR